VSFAVDVNLLLYASDRASPHHEGARRFLERGAAGPEILCLAWPTLMSYLRMSTHPAIFRRPLTPPRAMRNVRALLELPHSRALGEGEGFWAAYNKVVGDQAIRGNLVPDAHLAALLLEHEVRVLYTADRDFRRFDFLDIRDPLAES
jgi:uncharacterized protein